MIIRSTVARYIMASGLHPSFGLHHSNKLNPMRLVDDVMEPFRPYVDFAVLNLEKMGLEEVNAKTKPILAGLLQMEILGKRGVTTMTNSIQETCLSLAKVFIGEQKKLTLPDTQLPLWQNFCEQI